MKTNNTQSNTNWVGILVTALAFNAFVLPDTQAQPISQTQPITQPTAQPELVQPAQPVDTVPVGYVPPQTVYSPDQVSETQSSTGTSVAGKIRLSLNLPMLGIGLLDPGVPGSKSILTYGLGFDTSKAPGGTSLLGVGYAINNNLLVGANIALNFSGALDPAGADQIILGIAPRAEYAFSEAGNTAFVGLELGLAMYFIDSEGPGQDNAQGLWDVGGTFGYRLFMADGFSIAPNVDARLFKFFSNNITTFTLFAGVQFEGWI